MSKPAPSAFYENADGGDCALTNAGDASLLGLGSLDDESYDDHMDRRRGLTSAEVGEGQAGWVKPGVL